MQIALGIIFGLIGIVILLIIAEILYNTLKKPVKEDCSSRCYETGRLIYLLYLKKEGKEVEDKEVNQLIDNALRYVNNRYDCSDFRVTLFIRILKDYADYITKEQYEAIKTSLLGFRYWMNEDNPKDNMCFWSENHQLIFAVSEYLVGQMFEHEVFANDNKKGYEHKALAEKRIDIWLNHRFDYGYSEWNSNNYFPESFAPIANFIQYSTDKERVLRMKMALELMLFDIALGSFRYTDKGRTHYVFNTTSGRAYADNKISDKIGNLLRPNLECLLQGEKTRYIEDGWETKYYGRVMVFRLMLQAKQPTGEPYYEIPDAIRAIFEDNYTKGLELKQSNSLDIAELVAEGLVGTTDEHIMLQLGMEAFTDYRIINNTLKYINKNKMLQNEFLAPFRFFNSKILIKLGVLKGISKHIPLLPNGTALQRANIYIYKTPHYVMSTAQNYQADNFGAQQHIWTASITNELSLFTTHPARRFGKDGSPSYWIGNGRNPHSAQYKNINMSLYRLPTKRGIGESHIVRQTHAYCPLQYLEEYTLDYLDSGYMFGRSGDTVFMMRSNGKLWYRDLQESIKEDNSMREKVDSEKVFSKQYDLINETDAEYHYWITQLSTLQEEQSFAKFIKKCLANKVVLDKGTLVYKDNAEMRIEFGKAFFVDNTPIDTNYARYENKYCGYVERKPKGLIIKCKDKSLELDFEKNIRKEL